MRPKEQGEKKKTKSNIEDTFFSKIKYLRRANAIRTGFFFLVYVLMGSKFCQ